MNKKITKKLSKIVEQHTVDTDFSASYSLGLRFDEVLDNLSKLQEYSTRQDLSWRGLSDVVRSSMAISKILQTISADKDKKVQKKYSSLLAQIEQETSELNETIKQNNYPNSTVDEAIAGGVMQELTSIKEQEEKDFGNLSTIAKSGRKNFTTEHVEGDDFLLVASMKAADGIVAELPNLPIDEKVLSGLLTQSGELNDTISSNVIAHYDSLREIDKQQNHDAPLIRDSVVKSLKESKSERDL